MKVLRSYADFPVYGGGLKTRPAEKRQRSWFIAMWACNIPMYLIIPLSWVVSDLVALTLLAALVIGWLVSAAMFIVSSRAVWRAMDADFARHMQAKFGVES